MTDLSNDTADLEKIEINKARTLSVQLSREIGGGRRYKVYRLSKLNISKTAGLHRHHCIDLRFDSDGKHLLFE